MEFHTTPIAAAMDHNGNNFWTMPVLTTPLQLKALYELAQQTALQQMLSAAGVPTAEAPTPEAQDPSSPPSSATVTPPSAPSSSSTTETSPESPTPSERNDMGATPRPRKRYACPEPGCEATVSRKFLLAGHMRTHTKEKPFQCRHCEKSFGDASNLRVHEQTHSSEKPFQCNVCGKRFAVSHYRTKHMHRKHKTEI